MVKYRLIYGSGTVWPYEEIVEMEEPTMNYNMVLDAAIDQMEARGETGQFINWNETVKEGGDYYEDEYFVGGNHGLILLHYGRLQIEQID